MKLYELAADYQSVLDLIADGSERLDDTLESLGGAIEDKVENIAKVIKTLEAETAGLKSEETRLADRRKSIENNVKRLKDYAEQSMLSIGKRNIKGTLFTVLIQKNPPRLEVLDDSLIPESFFVPQPPTLDKKAVTAELKAGNKVDGVLLLQGESLRIK